MTLSMEWYGGVIDAPELNATYTQITQYYHKVFGVFPDDGLLIEHRPPAFEKTTKLLKGERDTSFLAMARSNYSIHPPMPGIWTFKNNPQLNQLMVVYIDLVFATAIGYESTIFVLGPSEQIQEFAYVLDEEATKTYAYEHIREYTWDDLILDKELKDVLIEEVKDFFDGREVYRSLGIPWKKGLLFCGPPGNGKTSATKIISCVYKVSTKIYTQPSPHELDSIGERKDLKGNIRPQIIVFEDIDRVFSEGRSSANAGMIPMLLNKIDGYQEDEGVLYIATANDEKSLDPAIRSRPSRFDRVLTFKPPELDVRRQYLEKMLTATSPWEPAKLAMLATDFSFAFLRELVICLKQKERKGVTPSQEEAQALVKRLKSHLDKADRKMGIK